MFGADGQENIPHREWLQIFDNTLNRFKADLKRQGREDEFIGAKVRLLHPPSVHFMTLGVDYIQYFALHRRGGT
jgi:hypothetical protein